jgi:hypothetical protein
VARAGNDFVSKVERARVGGLVPGYPFSAVGVVVARDNDRKLRRCLRDGVPVDPDGQKAEAGPILDKLEAGLEPDPRERTKLIVFLLLQTARANVRSHAHALRAAFAVRFDEAHPDQLLALKDLLGNARLETTLVYLRRRKKQLAMERVRDLSWGSVGGFVLQSNAVEAHTGFEPVLPP